MIYLGVTYTERGQLKMYNRVNASSFSLPLAERSVLLFMLQRTVGWHKVWEAISVTEFVNGVFRKREGRRHVIVRGTGLPSEQVIRAIAVLREMGAIEIEEFGSRTIYRIIPEWLHPDLRGGAAYAIWEVSEPDYIHHRV